MLFSNFGDRLSFISRCYFSSVIQEEFWWNMSGSVLCAITLFWTRLLLCGNLIHKMWLLNLEINLIFFHGPECYYICVHLCHHNSLLSCCELPLVFAGVLGKFDWSRTLENKKVSDKMGLIIVRQTKHQAAR